MYFSDETYESNVPWFQPPNGTKKWSAKTNRYNFTKDHWEIMLSLGKGVKVCQY